MRTSNHQLPVGRWLSNAFYISLSLLLVSQMFMAMSLAELKDDYATMKAEKDFWVLRNQETKVEETTLVSVFSSLKTEHDDLITDYNELREEHSRLEEEAMKPPYIVLSGRAATLVWRRIDGSIASWKIPIDSYRDQILQEKPKRYLIVQDDNGALYKVMDFRPFVESQPFEKFSSELYKSVGGDQAFIEEIWNLVTQLSSYTSDIGETPRWPLETLVEGGGDCEDTTVLITSLLLASGEMDEVAMVYMDADDPGNLRQPNHLIVYVRAGDYETFIDGTAGVMNPYGEEVDGFYYSL